MHSLQEATRFGSEYLVRLLRAGPYVPIHMHIRSFKTKRRNLNYGESGSRQHGKMIPLIH
eukprot:3370797-Rhodomonas_salina.1